MVDYHNICLDTPIADWTGIDFLSSLKGSETDELKEKLKETIVEFQRLISARRLHEPWTCEVCDKSTWDVDFDYLVSQTLHLGCALDREKK